MIGAFGVVANEIVKLGIRLQISPRLNFMFDKRGECVGGKNFTRDADCGTEILHVLGSGHVVEKDLWIIAWDR